MITVNSLSGGKTSSYIAKEYPADYNVFALITVKDKKCEFPDKKIRQLVSDKIGKEFIGTVEDDTIIYTMLDLEQFIGSKINWLSGGYFEDIMLRNGKTYVPQSNQRYCTTDMKVNPIKKFWQETINEPCEMRIGFRANEQRRAKTMLEKLNKNGLESDKFIIGKHKNGNNQWKELEWRKPSFPLIKDGLFKDDIEKYWKDKPVRFAWLNNCVGCMGANPFYIIHQHNKNKNKINWFIEQEKKSIEHYNRCWRIDGLSYEKIVNRNKQFELFDEDFNKCDSGYCGL